MPSLIILLSSFSIGLMGASGPVQPPSVEEVAHAVEAGYREFQKIEYLQIKFSLEYQHIAGPRNFALDRAEVETRRHGKKIWLRIRGYPAARPQVHEENTFAWDGRTGTAMQRNDYNITKFVDGRIYHYNYYVDFLGYPDASGRMPRLTPRNVKFATPWLPSALTENLSSFVLRIEEREAGGPVDCILDRPRHETMWFDPQKDFALRQRDLYNSENGRLRSRTTFQNHEKVKGAWLPRLVVREEYGDQIDRDRAEAEPTGRKILTVEEISTEILAESAFQVPAPTGVTVHDPVRQMQYTYYTPGDMGPIVGSGELARKRYSNSRSWWVAIVVLGTASAILALAWQWFRTKRKAQSC